MSSTPSMNLGLVACSKAFLYNFGSDAAAATPDSSACSRGAARNESPLSSTILTKLKWLSGSVAQASSPTCKDIFGFVSKTDESSERVCGLLLGWCAMDLPRGSVRFFHGLCIGGTD
jgi:hypothetical protein